MHPFGAPADTRVIAKRLAPNRRLLCASPKYLARRGEPKSAAELRRHNCICIRQGDEAYGVWRLSVARDSGREPQARIRTFVDFLSEALERKF